MSFAPAILRSVYVLKRFQIPCDYVTESRDLYDVRGQWQPAWDYVQEKDIRTGHAVVLR